MIQLTPMPANFQQPIRSAIAEALGLSWYDLAPTMIHFRNVLTAAAASATDTFRVEGGWAFVAWEMRAHIGMNSMSTEALSTTATSLLALPGAKNRTIVKAMNARCTLSLPDAEGVGIIETDVQNSTGQLSVDGLPLSALMPLCGGAPVRWVEGNDVLPLIIPEDNRIKCVTTLNDVATVGGATSAGASTEYGVSLIGAFIRARAV